MEILQTDIKVNDFILRIKDNGEWIRLDTCDMIEADDYHLDFTEKAQVIATCMILEKYEKEYQEVLHKIKCNDFLGANKLLQSKE